MRHLLLLCLMTAGCSGEPTAGIEPGTFAGSGRDRLCVAAEGEQLRAGLISYAASGAGNCSITGALTKAGEGWVLTPRGEGDCKVALSVDADAISVTSLPASCSYYCGPGTSLDGKTFKRDPAASQAVDLAGEPLC